MHNKGTQINKLIINKKAKELYCSEEVLAERATYNHFVHSSLEIYYENTDEYTFRFLHYCEKIKKVLAECDNEKERNETIYANINDYNL